MVHTKIKGQSVISLRRDYRQASGLLGSILTGFRQRELSFEQRQVELTVQDINWGLPSPAVTSKVKRLVDIVGAVVGLGLVAALLIPIAIAIQIDHPGPIFFSQTRYGYRGRPFRIWKFRSMIPDAEAKKHTVENEAKGLIFKNEADPRITRIGRFLRRTSLDELPQFFNVLTGDMSLVGTRPPVLNEVIQYNRYHWRRLAVKPGMTGRWQTSGRSSIKDFEQIVEMDLDYQANWSNWLDIQIIFKTIAVVFDHKDAC
ncbi:Bacterial sugar transferase, putative [Synechococcus sp. PCC 7335]|uniref:sugar transferase n=1 Tax=Synechococcus sp. (strain ATCC 29403 / PCC 7335) TaxID=91464 RepID=UPI00017ED9D1|nr:sugar transferase [Synechococcus sp. PCC 7335]EDX85346.1 Bacterial sugar transferase, putative [Synechococcus sp. PCC 7335]